MFVTEVDSSRKKAVHDELARLLVQYIRQPDPVQISAVLEVSVPILQNHSITVIPIFICFVCLLI